MKKLSKTLYFNNKYIDYSRNKLDKVLSFKYINKNNKTFWINPKIKIEKIRKTSNLNINIYNLRYHIDLYSWSNKDQELESIDDFFIQDGRITKKYIDNKNDRKLIFDKISKNIKKIINNNNFPIVVRGIFTDFHLNNYRYKKINSIMLKNNYKIIKLSFTKEELEILNKESEEKLEKEIKNGSIKKKIIKKNIIKTSLKLFLFNVFKNDMLELLEENNNKYTFYIYINKKYKKLLKKELSSVTN